MTQERDRDKGPPEKERPQRSPNRQGPNHQESVTTTDKAKITTQPRQCRRNAFDRHADAWRAGFGYGFRDALRLIHREVDDPQMRLILSRIADRYGPPGMLPAEEPHAVTGRDTR